jgi:hypothetical protein
MLKPIKCHVTFGQETKAMLPHLHVSIKYHTQFFRIILEHARSEILIMNYIIMW